ncbi:unnamed protein product, partial [Brassica oleracea]
YYPQLSSPACFSRTRSSTTIDLVDRHRRRHSLILAAADVTFFIDAKLIKCRASAENRNQIQHRSAAREREKRSYRRERMAKKLSE